MDIPICLEHLGRKPEYFRLSQSVPPHTIEEWVGGDPQPSEVELQAAWDDYLAEQAATAYQRQRQPEYPPISDLADALYWASKGDTTKLDAYYAACAAVKTKYPKPEVTP